jgi:hypothetical protein
MEGDQDYMQGLSAYDEDDAGPRDDKRTYQP